MSVEASRAIPCYVSINTFQLIALEKVGQSFWISKLKHLPTQPLPILDGKAGQSRACYLNSRDGEFLTKEWQGLRETIVNSVCG